MKFAIITPTLQRDSLVRCVDSIDRQTHKDWEHIVGIDDQKIDYSLMGRCCSDKRIWISMGQRCGNYGNHARHEAWKYVSADWILYVDDDNFLADDRILEDMATILEGVEEQWAIFPIHRHGRPFFYDPPGCCYVDSANMVVRREIGRWPDIEAREADGYLCDVLKDKYPYKAFPNFRPIIVMEKSSNGA